MAQDHALRTVAGALRSPTVVDFVKSSVKAGYQEFFSAYRVEVCAMVDHTFDRLWRSQSDGADPDRLVETTSALLQDTFRKSDPSFWFNRIYHQYKTQIKPESDFERLQDLLPGKRVLDYGCGSGYLAARLAKGGYQVLTTDVLDYRYPEARHLPFVRMASATDISYPDDSVDVALVLAVLHHIDPKDLPGVLQRLGEISKFALIKEDTYGLPDQIEGLRESLGTQPLLRTFAGMTLDLQRQVLVLIDFFANAIAQGIPEMNMPFEFKTVTEWERVLLESGFRVNKSLVVGFEPGRMHKSCHVWLVCERTGTTKAQGG
ncbi:MAG: class I SAM-dependent methyltransferase [Terriglobales bacterium]